MTITLTPGTVRVGVPGLAPALPNDATKYLDGTGAYSVPAGGGGGSGLIIQEADGSPLGTATVLVLPNGTLGFSGGTATYTPAGGGGGLGLSVPIFARTVTATGFSPNDVTLDTSPRLIAIAAAQVTSSVVVTSSGAYYLTVWRNGVIQEQITVSASGTTTITPFTPDAGDTIWMTVSNGGVGATVSGSLDIASGGWS